MIRRVAGVVGAALLAACAAGPDYQRPSVDMPVAWKLEEPWREGAPNDGVAKGAWWKQFGDAQLDALEGQALDNSPTLALASARLDAGARQRRVERLGAVSPVRHRGARGTPENLRQPSADQLRLAEFFDRAERFHRRVHGQLRNRHLRPHSAHDRRRARLRRAERRRSREYAPAADDRSRRGVLQPARARHRARRARTLDRAAAPRARAGDRASRSRRRHRARASRSSRRCSTARSRRSTFCANSARSSSTRSRPSPARRRRCSFLRRRCAT